MLYKLLFHYTTPDEKSALSDQREALGIRQLLAADMSWSNQKFRAFTVDLFPNLNAVKTYDHLQRQASVSLPGESYLGIPMDENYPDFFAPTQHEGESPVYRVYFSRPTTAVYDLEQKKYQSLVRMANETRTHTGGRPLIAAYMRWNNEEWEYFGVERFPNTEAILTYSQFLTENEWYRYTHAVSYIGVATGGILSGLE